MAMNQEDFRYILEWAKRNGHHNSVKELFDFIHRKESNERIRTFGVEPLLNAWNNLTNFEQIALTHELAKVYLQRSLMEYSRTN
ncbi:hypothetical protein ABD87_00310 [Lysinibacillus sphaericus]|uniref:hypothetical protein n=1 Tax=Lysinibacillus sphaericus TaxID=1421 RepID=UPI0018CDF995|nr:hypothetical protein [Lysinibacillus sphaericus]MBG9728031.1 hypothetical protein [Lysinibacillus sphaericus]